MNRKHVIETLVALVALGAVHPAQTVREAKPVTAEATAVVEPVAPIRLQVAGMTPETAKALQTAMLALQADVYACDPCRIELAKAGTCSKCSATLQPVKKPVLASVAPAPADGTLTLTLQPKRSLRISEVERILSASSASIDRARQPLAGRIVFVATCPTADRMAQAEKALREAQLFEELKASFEPSRSEVRLVVRPRATPPLHLAHAIEVLEAQQLRLLDVVFGHVQPASL